MKDNKNKNILHYRNKTFVYEINHLINVKS